MCIISLVSSLQCWSQILAHFKFQARKDLLDKRYYPESDYVNTQKFDLFPPKRKQTYEEKKIANELSPPFVSAKTSRNENKAQDSSIKKKKESWLTTGRCRDKEHKLFFLYADVKRRNRESQLIPHEKQGINLSPHDELAIRHCIKKNKKKTVKLHLRPWELSVYH